MPEPLVILVFLSIMKEQPELLWSFLTDFNTAPVLLFFAETVTSADEHC